MKKLMFATALVASAAAFADGPTALNATSFEEYTANGSILSDKGDTQSTKYFCYTDGDADGSLVKAFDGEGNLTTPSITRPLYYASVTPNANYLELSTEGGILWRSINVIQGEANAYTLGRAQPVAADGTYLDTLVQFTATEDGNAPTTESDDKLAIWLNVDANGVTNLMVQAGFVDVSGAPVASNFVLTGTSVVAGEWHRLTIKAVDDVIDPNGYGLYYKIPAFIISIDGTEMAATVAPIDASFAELEGAIASEFTTLVAARKVFPSLVQGSVGDPATLQGIGFKGSGALDDIVWTEENPFALPADGFTLTWPADMTAVSYTLGTGSTPVPITGSSPFMIRGVEDGALIYFLVQNADGAQKLLQATKGDGVTGIDATGTTFGWPEYLGNAVNGAYTIDDADDLGMLRKGVAAGLATVGETFNQTANIDMSSAGPFAGIGTYNANLTNGVPFCGTYDGQGYKISNIDFTQRNYGGVFNQVKGGTIKNLTVDMITCSTFDSSVNSGEWGCSIIGNVGLGSTVQGLTAMGSFGSAGTPCTHNVAGIAIRVCGGASNVVNGVIMLETLVKDCTNNATLYGSYTKCGGMTALTQDQNGVPNDYVLYDGCVNNANIAMVAGKGTEGRDGLSGILGYVSDGTKIKDCVNNGTLTSVLATAKIGGIVGWAQGRFLDDLGGNKNPAAAKMIGDPAGSTITGFYATTDNGVATTVTALAKDTTYLLERNVPTNNVGEAEFTLAAAGDTIAFDTVFGYTFAGTIAAAEGLDLSVATNGTVITYTAAAQGGAQYAVTDGDTIIPITPQPEDFDLMVAAAAQLDPPVDLDTNDVTAVNALLATPIPGSGGVLAWQAAFLGVEPSTNGLAQVAIKSISFDENGKVVVEMADGVTLKTGRGVDIKLKLMVSSNLTDWTLNQTVTNVKEFEPVQPAAGETKKFYKVVVEFAAPQN